MSSVARSAKEDDSLFDRGRATDGRPSQPNRVSKRAMTYVCLLRSVSVPTQRHVGKTDDLKRRLAQHNAGKSAYTRKHAPWRIAVAIAFEDDRRALEFEQYLKTGLGHAFASRHFW